MRPSLFESDENRLDFEKKKHGKSDCVNHPQQRMEMDYVSDSGYLLLCSHRTKYNNKYEMLMYIEFQKVIKEHAIDTCAWSMSSNKTQQHAMAKTTPN